MTDPSSEATASNLRQAFLTTLGLQAQQQQLEEAGIDEMIVDYLVCMLVEEEVADEEVPEMLTSYLASVEELLDTDTLTLDVPLLRARLRGMEKEGAEKEQEREQLERRRQVSGSMSSMGSNAARREGRETKEEEEQQQQQQPPHKEDGEGDETYTDTATSTDTYTEEEIADIAFLKEFVPSNIPHDILLYVYITKCLKRRQRAAEILVESASEEGIVALREEKDRHEQAKLHAQEKQKQDQEKLKQQIVNRFADVVTIHDGGSSSSSSGSNNNRKAQGLGAPVFAKGEESKVRFRDGQAVAFKGEKYVIEDLTPTWDGGSRGRVKTKGKRGPGFV